MPKLIHRASNGRCEFLADTVELAGFGAVWPCFGPIRRDLRFTLDCIGDLIEIDGDAGLDENGVSALISDARETHYRERI